MNPSQLYPLESEADRLTRHCKLAPHSGTANLDIQEQWPPDHPFAKWHELSGISSTPLADAEFGATVLTPAEGNCLVLLRGDASSRLSRNFGTNLVVTGESPDGPFRLHCPQFFVVARSSGTAKPAWATLTLVNQAATLTYGDPRPITRVTAIINNFDFESGNTALESASETDKSVLRVLAAGKTVDFRWRDDHQEALNLLELDVLHSAALTEFSFDAWDQATETELSEFAYNVASLCSLAARQHTGVPVLTFLDANGRPVKRILGPPVMSKFRRNYILRFLQFDFGLPKLFLQSFEKYNALRRLELWKALPGFCASIEDSPYLEQRTSTLMAALELLFRNSLVEEGYCTQEQAEKKRFLDLIGAARKKLRWDIPGHYTQGDQVRLLRNAVAHGGPLPLAPKKVRHVVDKWSLFLMRRILIRVGFDGKVAAAEKGHVSSSPVNNFTEAHNSFET